MPIIRIGFECLFADATAAVRREQNYMLDVAFEVEGAAKSSPGKRFEVWIWFYLDTAYVWLSEKTGIPT